MLEKSELIENQVAAHTRSTGHGCLSLNEAGYSLPCLVSVARERLSSVMVDLPLRSDICKIKHNHIPYSLSDSPTESYVESSSSRGSIGFGRGNKSNIQSWQRIGASCNTK